MRVRLWRRAARPLVALSATLLLAAPGSAMPQPAPAGQAPFGSEITNRIPTYVRVAPHVATSAALERLGVLEAKGVGFEALLDMRPDELDREDARQVAEFALLRYFRVPVGGPLPSEDELTAIVRIIDDPANHPILVHGVDADRTGAVWALYRHRTGYPPEIALEEGRTAGLEESEPLVRERLGLPPE